MLQLLTPANYVLSLLTLNILKQIGTLQTKTTLRFEIKTSKSRKELISVFVTFFDLLSQHFWVVHVTEVHAALDVFYFSAGSRHTGQTQALQEENNEAHCLLREDWADLSQQVRPFLSSWR